MKQMTIIPRISEKAYAVNANGVYVFRVPLNLNKNAVSFDENADGLEHLWAANSTTDG